MRKLAVTTLAALSLGLWGPASLRAGTVNYDFNTDPGVSLPGYTNFGNALWVSSGGVTNSGYVQLTDTGGLETGVIVLPDFDNGAVIKAFSFSASVMIGGGSDTPGAGWSINFVNDTNLFATGSGFGCDFNSVCDKPERGTAQGLSFAMLEVSATAGGGDVIGPNIHYNQGTSQVALFSKSLATFNGACTNANSLQTGPDTNGLAGLCWAPITATMTNGVVNLWWKGVQVIQDFQVPGWSPSSGRFVIAGATSNVNYSAHLIDNVSITTLAADTPWVTYFNGNAGGFSYTIEDIGAVSILNSNSIVLNLDGTAVTNIQVSKSAGLTTVSYSTAPNFFAAGSSHTVALTFSSTGGASGGSTNTFKVPAYITVPASYAVTGVDTSQPGFRARPYQTTAANPGSVAWTELQLTGAEGPNIADLSGADAQGFYSIATVINLDEDNTVANGHFNSPQYPDAAFPGLASGSQSGNPMPYGSEEIITFLYFPAAGTYTMGVNSDDGFKLTTAPSVRNPAGLLLCQFDGPRSSSDTMTTFLIQKPGYYPFRLLYFNVTGGANLEWFTQQSNGSLALVNDTTNPTAIRAYRAGPNGPPYVRSFNGYFAGFEIDLQDGGTTVNAATVQTLLDSTNITPSITQTSGITAIVYTPAVPFPPNSSQNVQLVFADSAAFYQTNNFAFTVAGAEVPAVWAVPSGSVDKTQIGFRTRTYQTTAVQPGITGAAIEWSELQLAGFKGPNIADQSLANNGWVTNNGTPNYDIAGSSGTAGHFNSGNGYPANYFPGLPGLSNTTDNASMEILTLVEFPVAGTYTMGVNSDDGFKVTIGPDPRDQHALIVGEFDGQRGAADTTFQFYIAQAGIYPMRLLWENGNGGASVQWFSVQADGTLALLNDPLASGSLKTYVVGPAAPAYVSTLSPNQNEQNVAPNAGMLIQITDGTTTVSPAGVLSVSLNGTAGTPVVGKSGSVTTVSNSWSGLLPAGSTNTATLVYRDSASTTYTDAWSFVVAPYASLPLATRTPPGSGDSTQPGFKVHPFQIPYGASSSTLPYDLIENAEQQLAGLWNYATNSSPPWYIFSTNLAILTGADTNGFLPDPTLVNFQAGFTSEQGNFTSANGYPDMPIPGLPGYPDPTTGTSTADYNMCGEIVTYVEFPAAGFYTMGVNSSSDFRVKPADKQGYIPWRVSVTSPASLTWLRTAGAASTPTIGGIGPEWPNNPSMTGKLVYVDNGTACAAPGNAAALAGNIALVDRGGCTFCSKLQNVYAAGAIAIVIVNNNPAYPIGMGGCSGQPIPITMISEDAGQIIEAALKTNDVYVTVNGLDPQVMLGQSDPSGGQAPTETQFSFAVPQSGVYPIRLVWENIAAGTEVEMFMVDPATGNRTLINDTVPGALKAYRARTAPANPPALSIARSGASVVITYEGVLQSATVVTGPYTDVSGATSPYTVPASGSAKFFRAHR